MLSLLIESISTFSLPLSHACCGSSCLQEPTFQVKLHAQHVPKELRGKCTASRKPALRGWFLHRTCAFVRPSLSMGLDHDWQGRGHTTDSRRVKQNRLFVSNIRGTSLMFKHRLACFPFSTQTVRFLFDPGRGKTPCIPGPSVMYRHHARCVTAL